MAQPLPTSPLTPTAFQYCGLTGSDIRLLTVLPGDAGADIQMTLQQIPLDSKPRYVALSYTWGDATILKDVQLNDRPFRITENLHSALAMLRSDPGLSDLYIWADAICINQESKAEKSSQVPRMTQIYSSAEQVIAWLGPNTREDDIVFGLLFEKARSLSRLYEAYPPAQSLTSWSRDYPQIFHDYPFVCRAFLRLQQRPWFLRIWVVQEVALATKSPRIYAGGCSVLMDDLNILFAAYYSHEQIHQLGHHQHASFNSSSSYSMLMNLRLEHILAQRHATAPGLRSLQTTAQLLANMLTGTVKCEATIPHDRLYGLLGLLGSAPLLPDYGKPFEKIYHDYAVFILQNCGELDILHCFFSNLDGVPSWVPDFRHLNLAGNPSIPPMTKASPFLSADGLTLSLDGVLVGSCELSLRSVKRMEHLTGRLLQRTQEFESMIVASSERRALHLDEVRRQLLDAVATDHRLSSEASIRGYEALRSGEEAGDSVTDEVEVAQEALRLPLLVTSTGMLGYLEKLDVDAEAGDLVCVFKGSRLPSLLRPLPGRGGLRLIAFFRPIDDQFLSGKLDDGFFKSREVSRFDLV